MVNKPRVEVTEDGMVHLICDQNGGHAHELDAGESWDLGDDLLIASGTIWQAGTGQKYNPGWSEAAGLTDKDFLDERATAILFTDEQMEDLRVLAAERGKTLPQMIREEMLATLEFASWEKGLTDEEVAEGPPIPGRPVLPMDGFVVGSSDVDVAQDTEGEDGHGHAEPAEPDAAGEPEGRQAAQDHGDQVQDDREGAHGA